MANGKLTLSEEGLERLSKIMSELDVLTNRPEDKSNKTRPETLRLAFTKGLTGLADPPKAIEGKPSKFVIPEGVIARGDDYLLIKHLIVHKLQIPVEDLDEKKVDDYIIRYVEAGLEIMNKEIASLNSLDNYLLWLLDSLNKKPA